MARIKMNGAKSLLDSLLGQVGSLSQGQGASGLGAKAKQAWSGQSGMGKGAIAGGLLGVLMAGGGRKMLGTGVQVGGAALIGGLAYKAYEDWKAGKSATAATTGPLALPTPEGTAFMPSDPLQANDLSTRLVQAMVAAAKADGHVTPEERDRINTQLSALGLEADAQAMIAAELDTPLDPGRIAALARNEEEAAEIYAASLLTVDPNGAAEKGYLSMLAARLKLDPGLVAHLHAKADQLT